MKLPSRPPYFLPDWSWIVTLCCSLQDEDFQEMEEAAQRIESQYWQLFDHVIINDELRDSCVQLLTAVSKAQDEPQWVPASWIRASAQV